MKIFLLLLALVLVSQAQVLGIDFGTQFWKASLISPGKNLVIVENSRSGRKSINGIAFHDDIRHFQDDALYKRLKKPDMSHFYLNKLLRSLDFQAPIPGYLFQNGTYYITHKQNQISLQQLVGMILKSIKLHASLQAGSQIKDTVLAIPANWGWKAKTALINAAAIAQLSVLGLINQNSAAAINFAITRNDTQPINIAFFNLGSHNLQFSIMQFFGTLDQVKGKNIQSLKVLSHLVVQDVGGLQVDREISNYLAEQFMKKHNVDPRLKQKSLIKLMHKASQVKQTLSANKQCAVYIQGLINGLDLSTSVSRQIIQSMPVFKLLTSHLQTALTKAGLKKQSISLVQLIGGASRIPLVGKIVKQYFEGVQVGAHINGDQAMAFGSSLRAANLSIAFRVKQLHFYDGNQQEVKVIVAGMESGVITEQKLFTRDSQHGDRRVVSIKPTDQEIKVTLYYGDQIVKQFLTQNITQWKTIYTEDKYNYTTQPNIVLNFALSSTNIVDLKEIYTNLTFNYTSIKQVDEWVEQEVLEVMKNQTSQQTKNETQTQEPKVQEQKGQQTKDKAQQPQGKTQQTQNKSEQAQNKTQQIKNKTQQVKNKTQQVKKVKPKLKKITSQVQQHRIQPKKQMIQFNLTHSLYPQLTKPQLQSSKSLLSSYQKHETYLQQKSKIRNDLQSTLYRLQSTYDQPYIVKFGIKKQIDNLKKVVGEKLIWLEDNAWTAEKDQFVKHYDQVFVAYKPFYNRSQQYTQRQKTYNQTMKFLSMTYQKTIELNNTHPWIADKVELQLQRINQTVQQMHDRLKEQSELKLHENPTIYNHQMKSLAEKLRDQYYLLKMTPRPKVKRQKKIETKAQQKVQATQEAKKSQQTQKPAQTTEQSIPNQKSQTTQQNDKSNQEQSQQNQKQNESTQAEL